MKKHICLPALLMAFLPPLGACGGEILPEGWLTPDLLSQAEQPIQEQLDTGRGMRSAAWSMAAVKDARLLLIYLEIYERLPNPVARKRFLSEQQAWLKKRQKEVHALYDPEGGSIVPLEQASKQMELTDERIATLEKRLAAMKTAASTSSRK